MRPSFSKVRVHTSLLGTDPPCRIVDQQRIEEIPPVVAEVVHKWFISVIPFGKAGLVVGKASHARPVVLSRRAQKFEDFKDLVDFRVAREEWFASTHFGEDAAD